MSCELIDIDGLRGSARSLYVPTTGMGGDSKRADHVCAEVAGVAEHQTDGVALGYTTVIVEGKDNVRLTECTVDR